MPSIYDELVASSSALYEKESAVDTERKMLEMRQKERAYRQGRARENKQKINSRIAGLLGLLSSGYREIKSKMEMEKKFDIMSANPEFELPKEEWKKMDEATKNMYWSDYVGKNPNWYEAWANTPLMKYGEPTITPYTSNYQKALYK